MRYNYFWIGLQKVDGVWTFLDNSVPSYEEIHWYGSEPGTTDEVAEFFSYEGNSWDLLTYGTSRTYTSSNLYTLCEYNCL